MRNWKCFRGQHLELCTSTTTDINKEKKIMKTIKKIGNAIAKKCNTLKGRPISTTATDTEWPRTSDMPNVIEEVTDNLEVKEQSETTDHKATDTETDNYYTRIINKESENLTFTNLDVKAVKQFKMLQHSNSKCL